ncbi:MAG TPA: outer membrane protein assembly factor BamD [Oceanospirillales bacterium]|nr:outer membrane protein assembly factor BamD [Oceanospirillaceae bacterium]HBS42065.1 outer membrane protein assembly factor BamD [Oceanospirillales bacterium]|tara:strand:- start:230 stop:1072 length:843 start_codon:yes stop_codon:yes gene_type:complete
MRASPSVIKILALSLVLGLAACSSNKDKEILTEQEYYREARQALDKNNLIVAQDRLRRLENQYPFGRYAEQAQLELIYVLYRMSDMEEVLTASERFIRLHPQHEQVDYAYYMRGLATYEMAFTFIERYFSDDIDRRNPAPLRDSFAYFSELIQRYPGSPYNADARARMIYLRERMASYEVEVARYYMKRHAYLAAANRCESVVTEFQHTASVGDALAIMTEAYHYLELDDKAQTSLAVLKLNYPDHEQLVNGKFMKSGLADVDRRSFLNIVSFGILDSRQ